MAKTHDGAAMSKLVAKPGIYPGVPDEEYRGLLARSASDLKSWVDGPGKSPSRAAVFAGSVLHEIIADPVAAGKRYATTDGEFKLNTKEGRTAMDAFEMSTEKVGVRPSEKAQIGAMLKALKEHPGSGPVLKAAGDSECACVAEFDGVPVKCLADKLVRKNGDYTAIVDWKTTSALSSQEFLDSIVRFRYDVSAAYYVDIVHANTGKFLPFFWICVSKRSYEVWITKLDPLFYSTGRRWYQDVLTLWARHVGVVNAEK